MVVGSVVAVDSMVVGDGTEDLVTTVESVEETMGLV